ncbi:hypothetical protein ACFLYA_01995 [Candidatus Dependentiae bacterium]
MLSKIKSYFHIFWLLTRADMVVFRQIFWGRIINTLFWSGSVVIVSAFILPSLGMTEKFGEFIVVSSIISGAYWGIWDSSYKILSDLEGEKEIDYKLSLPIPSWMVMFQYAIKHTIERLLPSLIVLPVFKLILGSRMDLSNFSFFKFAFIFITISLFTGFFFLLIASFVESSHKVDNVGIRLLFPLWFFGAGQYSWSVMHGVNSKIGCLILANPLVYAMEGIHAAVLGQQGYISFWVCAAVLWAVILVFGFVGIWKFKKRLDFV